jgi:superfamily II DNA/RNA helicase
VHRIGRTGRAGLSGRAFSIATSEDGRHVEAIQKLIGKEIPVIPIDGLEQPEFEEGDDRRGRGRGRGRAAPRDAEAASSAPRGRRRGERRPEPQVEAMIEAAPETIEEEAPRFEAVAEPVRSDNGRAARHREDRQEPRGEGRGSEGRGSEARSRGERSDLRAGGRPDRQRDDRMRDDRQRDDRRRRRDEDEIDEVVLGFGDHVPAFMTRRARPLAAAAFPGGEEA